MGYVGKVTAGGATHYVSHTLYGTPSVVNGDTLEVTTGESLTDDDLMDGLTVHAVGTVTGGTSATMIRIDNMTSTYILRPTTAPKMFSSMALHTFTYSSGGGGWYVDEGTNYPIVSDAELAAGTSVDHRVVSAKVIHDYVASQMSDVAGALVYKGTVTAESSLLNTALKKGWYYIVAMPNAQTTSITIAGQTCEAGDMVIVHTGGTYTTSSALAGAVDIIQSNTTVITNAEIDTIVAS